MQMAILAMEIDWRTTDLTDFRPLLMLQTSVKEFLCWKPASVSTAELAGSQHRNSFTAVFKTM